MSITVVIIDCVNPDKALNVIKYCRKLKWHKARYFLFTDALISSGNDITVIQITPINSILDYNNFILRHLYKYIETDYCLIVQTDGFILNPRKWNKSFLEYDYIGAPMSDYPYWISLQLDVYKQAIVNCNDNRWPMNGGFSLRSKKLLELIAQCPYPIDDLAEDMYISLYYRDWFEQQGVKFPSKELAYSFSRENPLRDYEFNFDDCFGFHGKYSPKHIELTKIPDKHKKTLLLFKTKILGINHSFSLNHFIRLFFKRFLKIPLTHDEKIEYYIESGLFSYNHIQNSKTTEIDLILWKPTNNVLFEVAITSALKNIQQKIRNCYVISDIELDSPLFKEYNCTLIKRINIQESILHALFHVSSNTNICLLRGNTCIIKPVSICSRNKSFLFFTGNENSVSSNDYPLNFNTSIQYFNRNHIKSFLRNQINTEIKNNESEIQCYSEFIIRNYPEFYNACFNPEYYIDWNNEIDFFTKLYSLSDNLMILFKL